MTGPALTVRATNHGPPPGGAGSRNEAARKLVLQKAIEAWNGGARTFDDLVIGGMEAAEQQNLLATVAECEDLLAWASGEAGRLLGQGGGAGSRAEASSATPGPGPGS